MERQAKFWLTVICLVALAVGKRPPDVRQGVWCNSCQAIVRVMLQLVYDSRSEIDVG